MSIPGAASPLFIGAAAGAAAAFKIDRSIRLNKGDSAYLNFTPSSAGNRKTWTWSAWVKLTDMSGGQSFLFGAAGGFQIYFASNKIFLDGDGNVNAGGYWTFITEQVFRDPSAWYHLVFVHDTTQTDANDRFKIYVNGVQLTQFTTNNRTNLTQNSEGHVNNNVEHRIGRQPDGSTYANLYLTEVNFIDGQALAPTDFAETDSDNNWNPKEYSGSYGTNGFYLKFADNSSNSALGNDSSGNDNDWSVNNLSIGSFYFPATLTTNNGSFYSGQGPEKGFDGDSSTFCSAATAGNAGGYMDINVGAWGMTGALEVLANSAVHYSADGASATALGSSWTNVGNAQSITTLRLTRPGQSNTPGFYSMRIAGVELIENAAGTDSLIDTPTNYTPGSGNAGGNYATFNPLVVVGTDSFGGTNGNLDSSGSNRFSSSTIAVSSGKFYFETTVGAAGVTVGIWQPPFVASSAPYEQTNYRYFGSDGKIYTQAGSTVASYNTYTNGDVIGIALDMDNGKVFFSKNGTWQGSSDPAGGTNPAASGLTGMWVFGVNHSGDATHSANFGQRPFAYTPPTGFLSLCTTNLPDPTIADGSTAFDIDLYTGTNASLERSNFAFSPDFLWFKSRNASRTHVLIDTVRGRAKALESQVNGTDYTSDANRDLVSFDSDGFTVGQTQHFSSVNRSGDSIVVWAWDAGTSTASNTDGSITSSVRASQTNGCSIVSYTGNGTSPSTIGHGLNAVPGLIIAKNRDSTYNWAVYHTGLIDGSTVRYLRLNTTDGQVTGSGHWKNTVPTSSVFTVGNDGQVNANGDTYIAYCFAPVEGFSKFGTYTGNNSTDGPFVYTGFRPAWVMVKGTGSSNTYSWVIVDSARSTINPTDHALFPNSNENENDLPGYGARDFYIDLLSNGFKLRIDPTSINTDGGEYIYAAFAEHPFKTARAR